jgi:hypothetical protein
MNPPPNSQEFKVTNSKNAEFAQLRRHHSTKSGGDQFHAAPSVSQNDAGRGSLNSGDKPHKAYNTSVAPCGPLELPNSPGKAKTFFFADIEAIVAADSPFFFQSAMRGAISRRFTHSDPFTETVPSEHNSLGSACANPQDCVNPVALSLLNYLPKISMSAPPTWLQPATCRNTDSSNTNGSICAFDRTISSNPCLFAGASASARNRSLTLRSTPSTTSCHLIKT